MVRVLSIGGLVVLVAVGAFLVFNHSDHSDQFPENVTPAFAADMVPHHEGAIEMARIAKVQAEHPEVRELANNIISSQTAEIEILESIYRRVTGESVESVGDGAMGMSDSMMGMDMDMGALSKAEPFDREFIDQMIPHHQGAIRMSYMVLGASEDQETIELAEAIIAAQSSDIAQMNRWRRQWYGTESPAGGVPEKPEHGSSMMEDHSGMGH